MGGSSLKIYGLVVCMMYLDVKSFGAAGVCTVSLQWGLTCRQISRVDGNQGWLSGLLARSLGQEDGGCTKSEEVQL